MKTSTKIFMVYGFVLVAIQMVFLVNSLVQFHRLRPIATQMSQSLAETGIRHIEVDISQSRYQPDTRRWEGREYGLWIVKENKPHRSFYLGANLKTTRLSNDTLYIRALNDDLSWRPNVIPELRTSTIILPGGARVEKVY